MYTGKIINDEYQVFKRDEVLSPIESMGVINYSTEFSWGYYGSSPSQLSLAILLDYTGNKKTAVDYHVQFRNDVIAMFDMELNWELSEQSIEAWLIHQVADKSS